MDEAWQAAIASPYFSIDGRDEWLAAARRLAWESAPAGCATDREVSVIAAVVSTGSEKAAADRLGLSHSTVKLHLASARCSARIYASCAVVAATTLGGSVRG